MADTKLILHVKGTEETTSLPKPAVRTGIAQGQISYSQLIWSPIHNAWKQVRELPHLWPSQKLAPAPPPRPVAAPVVRAASATPIPKIQGQPKIAAGATPRITSPPKVTLPGAQPRIATGSAQPKIAVASGSHAVPVARARAAVVAATAGVGETIPEEDTSLHIARWACLVVGGLVLVALVLNYFLVDQPLRARLAQTPFAPVSVHAHFGAFIQPNALVVHIFGVSPTVTDANFPAFLVALAHSTPPRPGSDQPFDRVSLTPGWTGRYSFAGEDWEDLGKMGAAGADKQRQFVLDQIATASGRQLAGPNASAETRDQVWAALETAFTHQAPAPTSSPTDTNPSAQ